MKCPICNHVFKYTENLPETFTADCSSCGGLLLVENGTIYPFHQKLHSEDSRWPKDGKGAGCLIFEDTI